MTDIVTKLRDAIALEGISVVELRALLADAAATIERQRATIFTWEAAARFERGSMERPSDADTSTVIADAPTSTPR